jgi:predicted MPP superfamily phosphohydrolase
VITLARIAKLLRPEIVSSLGFGALRLGCYLIIPALIVFAGAINNNRLQVKEFSIELPQKSSTIKELKMVFASDFHLGQITNDRLLDRFVEKVNALHPDLILIGGDILEGHGNENLGRFEAQFRRLNAKYGVYAAPGNHESHSGSSKDFFVNSGMKLLEDELENIDNALYLVGRKDGRTSRKKPIEDLLKAAPDDLPVILVDHSPTDLESISRSRVDLQLSGHTHNGQLFPVNLVVMPFQYELAWGAKTKGHTQFIVSSGVQAWGPPVKTAGDSEILCIKATFRSDAELQGLRARSLNN